MGQIFTVGPNEALVVSGKFPYIFYNILGRVPIANTVFELVIPEEFLHHMCPTS